MTLGARLCSSFWFQASSPVHLLHGLCLPGLNCQRGIPVRLSFNPSHNNSTSRISFRSRPSSFGQPQSRSSCCQHAILAMDKLPDRDDAPQSRGVPVCWQFAFLGSQPCMKGKKEKSFHSCSSSILSHRLLPSPSAYSVKATAAGLAASCTTHQNLQLPVVSPGRGPDRAGLLDRLESGMPC